jgi:hypothetical protein
VSATEFVSGWLVQQDGLLVSQNAVFSNAFLQIDATPGKTIKFEVGTAAGDGTLVLGGFPGGGGNVTFGADPIPPGAPPAEVTFRTYGTEYIGQADNARFAHVQGNHFVMGNAATMLLGCSPATTGIYDLYSGTLTAGKIIVGAAGSASGGFGHEGWNE